MEDFILSNGVRMPKIGYGTYLVEDDAGVSVVKAALNAGYRHIDTAAFYGNETAVGQGMRASGLPREEIFVTTKVWNTDRGYEKAKASVLESLNRLGLDYIDLCLIHWPAAPHQYPETWEQLNLGTWRALTELYQEGKLRAIGVSNFKPHHLRALMDTEVPPMADQIEVHPGQTQEETVAYCQSHGILVEAWSPMGRGALLEHPAVTALAEKYRRTPAQICIRWCLEKGILPLPKSVTPARIAENTGVFSFQLAPEDVVALDTVPPTARSHDPDEVSF